MVWSRNPFTGPAFSMRFFLRGHISNPVEKGSHGLETAKWEEIHLPFQEQVFRGWLGIPSPRTYFQCALHTIWGPDAIFNHKFVYNHRQLHPKCEVLEWDSGEVWLFCDGHDLHRHNLLPFRGEEWWKRVEQTRAHWQLHLAMDNIRDRVLAIHRWASDSVKFEQHEEDHGILCRSSWQIQWTRNLDREWNREDRVSA